MNNILFRQLIKLKRKTMTKKQRERSRKIPLRFRPIYPAIYERKYNNLIRDIGNKYKNYMIPILQDKLIRWINIKVSTDVRQDSWIDEVNRFLSGIKSDISVLLFGKEGDSPEGTEIGQAIILIAILTLGFSDKQWKRMTESIIGFEFKSNNQWWEDIQKAWVTENVNLIKGLSDEYITKLNEIVFRGIRQGLRVEEIINEIEKLDKNLFGKRKDGKMSRGELIARDQVGKLNGQISKYKSEEVGLDIYVWWTSRDERVRGKPGGKYPRAIPSHWEMEGVLCKWSDGSIFAYSHGNRNLKELNWQERTGKMPFGIPGEEYLCRCTSGINELELYNEIDAEIDREEEIYE